MLNKRGFVVICVDPWWPRANEFSCAELNTSGSFGSVGLSYYRMAHAHSIKQSLPPKPSGCMQLVCFEWFLTMLTPKLCLGLTWDVLAGIAQSCARADLSSLVEQAFSCLKIFHDLARFSTVDLMMEPILMPQAQALLYRFMLCCTLT